MDINEYAKQSLISRKTMYWMMNQKMIENPLNERDIAGLKLIEKIWAEKEIIQAMLSQYPKNRRLRLLEGVEFKTKWERYAYGRFRNLKNGKRVFMKVLIAEIETTFNFSMNHHQIKQLYKIREKAYNYNKKEQKKSLQNSNSDKKCL